MNDPRLSVATALIMAGLEILKKAAPEAFAEAQKITEQILAAVPSMTDPKPIGQYGKWYK